MSARELLVKFQGEADPSVEKASNRTQDAIRGVAQSAEDSEGRTAGAMGRIGGIWAGITTKIVDLAASAGQAVGRFIGDSVMAASDLSETMGKAEAIFGEQTDAMSKWADASDTAFGLSKAAAMDAAAGFGDMFSQIGFTGDQAAGMSRDVVQMAADLGSFNNLETSDVLDKISASMRGEYDSLQSVIPNINAARVANEALAMSGKTSAAELTAQEKAAATLAIIQADGARAAGDFAKTSGGAANQQKIFAAQVENLQSKLGAHLLPVLTSVLQFITGRIMPGIDAFAERIGPVFELFAGWGEKVQGALSGFDLGPVGGAFASLAANVRPIIDDVTGFFRDKFGEWEPHISGVTSKVSEVVSDAMTLISDVVTRIGGGISRFWDRWGSTILSVASTAFETTGRLIGNVLGMIQGTIRTVTAVMRGDWDGAFQGIRQITDSVTDAVKNTLTGLVNVIGNLFGVDNLTAKITAGFKSAIAWINDTFIGGVNNVISKVGIDWSIPRIPGFAGGGFTGHGRPDEPAGIVHKGEVVWSQRDVAAWGGPGAVDAMRRWRGYEDGGIVGAIAGAAGNVLEFIRDPGSVLGRLWDSISGTAPGGLAGAFVQALRGLPKLIADKVKGLVGSLFSGGKVTPGGGLLPVNGIISSPYGFRYGPFLGAEMHDGVDIAAPLGTPVVSPLPGVVSFAGIAGGYGNMVRLQHGDFSTFYAHLDSILTSVGQLLQRGQVLGTVGSTGWSTGPHLHWGSSTGDPMALVYDSGGWLQPGVSVVENRSGRPEPVLTSDQWDNVFGDRGGARVVRLADDQLEMLAALMSRATVENLTIEQVTDPEKSAERQAGVLVGALTDGLEGLEL